jgi:5'-phosphate synthase pdxT subunit
MKIGILALQGNYHQHKKVMDILGIDNLFIRHGKDLDRCDSLIIPGGESTTISKQIDNNQLRNILINFASTHPIMGTCAGMIILSKTRPTYNMIPLGLIDFTVDRNAWGRQAHSFSAKINLDFDNKKSFNAIFIRSPKISIIGKDVQVVAYYKNEPVLMRSGMHLVSTFHPEIGDDFRIHEYFINKVNARIPALS